MMPDQIRRDRSSSEANSQLKRTGTDPRRCLGKLSRMIRLNSASRPLVFAARISRSAPAVVNLLISATNVVVKASASSSSETTEVRGPTRSSKSDADSASVRKAIVKSLEENDGNRMRTAKSLGIARSSLYRKMKIYKI